MSLRALVVVPPMTQLNRPYPAVPQLVGWLRHAGHDARGWDAALDLALRIFSPAGLERLFAAVGDAGVPTGYEEVVANAARYRRVIGPVVAFLQGRDPGLAGRIVRQTFLPQGPRFVGIDATAEAAAFGAHGIGDQARWLATLMLQDLADLLRASVSPRFGLTSYGAQVAASATSYDPLAGFLAEAPDPVEALLLEGLAATVPERVDLVALTCPFPGNLPGALRIGQWLRAHRPGTRIALGGGYPSTELRELADARIFDVVDHVVLDDGEAPLAAICADIARGGEGDLVRSFVQRMEGESTEIVGLRRGWASLTHLRPGDAASEEEWTLPLDARSAIGHPAPMADPPFSPVPARVSLPRMGRVASPRRAGWGRCSAQGTSTVPT